MNVAARPCLLPLALAASCTFAAAPDEALVGCWRSAAITQYFASGSTLEDRSGRCTLQYKDDRIESMCGTFRNPLATSYQYRVVRPNVYSATMTGSTYKTDLVGTTREYEYHVDGDRLLLVTRPQGAAVAASSAAIRVETEATRMPCP